MKTTALLQKVQKGFTLVELLVVIGILGVLVAALLATLDPLEQIRKGNDSARLSVAREYQQAYTRYYANNGYFPWVDPDGAGPLTAACTPATAVATDTTTTTTLLSLTNGTTGCNDILASTGELKTSKIPTNLNSTPNNLVIATSTTNDKVVVCYKPASKSQISAANTAKTDSVGGVSCTSGGVSPNQCYVCVQ